MVPQSRHYLSELTCLKKSQKIPYEGLRCIRPKAYNNNADYANFFLVKAKKNTSKCLIVESPTTDTATFEVEGSGVVWALQFLSTSDAKLKEDISQIESPLSKLLKLRGVSFRYKKSESTIQPTNLVNIDADSLTENVQETNYTEYISEEIRQKIGEEQNRKSLGLIAQEVEEFVPEVVRTAPNGYKSISYSDLIGLLIEAMKEQQKIIDSLAYDISKLESDKSSALKSVLITTSENSIEKNNIPVLYQNAPNPFNKETEIRFYIPDKVAHARLYLYNLQGNQIRSVIISQRGEGIEIIHGSDLQPGIYLYTLIADNIEIDTKRMILTD